MAIEVKVMAEVHRKALLPKKEKRAFKKATTATTNYTVINSIVSTTTTPHNQPHVMEEVVEAAAAAATEDVSLVLTKAVSDYDNTLSMLLGDHVQRFEH